MKRIITFVGIFFFVIHSYAQEDSAVTGRLKEKYDWVYYQTGVIGDGSAEDSRDWFYLVKKDEKYGACSSKGDEIIPPMYYFITLDRTPKKPYRHFFHVKIDEHHEGIYDDKGRVVVKPQYDGCVIEEECFLTKKNEQWGVNDQNGNEIISLEWSSVVPLTHQNNRFYLVSKVEGDKKYVGAFNSKGDLILPCEYQSIYRIYKQNFFSVEKNNLKGLVDLKGKNILLCEYNRITVYDSLGVAIVTKGGHVSKRTGYFYEDAKWGLVNLKGEPITSLDDYDYIDDYADGLFRCNRGGHYNEEGYDGGVWGFLDTKGNLVVPCQYESASDFKDGVAQVLKDGVSSIITNPLTGTTLKLSIGSGASEVDTNIPETGKNEENTFAFIFANENYTHFTGADYSINDGKIFKEYCKKTFGLPEKNIRYYEDATYGNIVGAIQKMQDIADVYDGDAQIIFYYSGLGATDQGRERYLLPVDASLETLHTTGYSMHTLQGILNALKTEMTWVIVDAPFSGVDKRGKMLAQHRGVQIAPKPIQPKGNTIVCLSSDKEETSWSDKKYGHSLFTYALLEQIQNVKGEGKICDIVNNAVTWVQKETMSRFDKRQSPSVTLGEDIERKWDKIDF